MRTPAPLVACLLLASCVDRNTPDDVGSGSGSGQSSDDGSSGGGQTGADTSTSAACTDFATGSLSRDSVVPGEVDTALGVTLEFRGVEGETLDIAFVCASNGEVLQAGPVTTDVGTAFELDVDGRRYEVAFAWVPGEDISFSVAVMTVP